MFYVFGPGMKQGGVPWSGRETLLTALRATTEDATQWPSPPQVRISRPGRNGEENSRMVINLPADGNPTGTGLDYPIEWGDIIVVPYMPGTFFDGPRHLLKVPDWLGANTPDAAGPPQGRRITLVASH